MHVVLIRTTIKINNHNHNATTALAGVGQVIIIPPTRREKASPVVVIAALVWPVARMALSEAPSRSKVRRL